MAVYGDYEEMREIQLAVNSNRGRFENSIAALLNIPHREVNWKDYQDLLERNALDEFDDLRIREKLSVQYNDASTTKGRLQSESPPPHAWISYFQDL